ncbi:MAG: carboxypeptidase-like regulatory domain-containing protein, partial [Terracidiphilus sp.]
NGFFEETGMQVIDVNTPLWRRSGPLFQSFVPICAAVALLLVLAVPATAQYGASLQGTVTDTTGAVIPGATIALTDKETNHAVTVTSGDTGLFTINQHAPSKYTITISRDGFKKKVIDNVSILSEQANSLTIKLEVGTATETVTVNAADQPVIDSETGNIGGTISQNDLAKMPDFGRDPRHRGQQGAGYRY